MSLAALRRDVERLKVEAAASKRERPEDKIAEFERTFEAIHVLVDPAKDPGGLPPVPEGVKLPTDRWTPAKLGPDQFGYLKSPASLNATAAGRRVFKTEALLRRASNAAITTRLYQACGFLCAPTQQQAKDIFWEPIKSLIPRWALATQNPDRDISESELKISLFNGAFIKVAGLDKPQRVEGKFWDFGGVTEFADCKPDVYDLHIEPMVMREGAWCDLEGVPEGRNHFYKLKEQVESGKVPDARYHHWTTERHLHLYLGRERAETKLAGARAKLDPLVYRQEYLGDWISFTGRAYYNFDREIHAVRRLRYNPNLPLAVCFDFNREPGVAAYVQELYIEDPRLDIQGWCTCVIGEVWIESNSNSRKVAQKVVQDWKHIHKGEVHVYGDASGGAGGSAKVDGSDWDLVRAEFDPWLGDRLKMYVPAANPAVRSRVNAVNTRLLAADGTISLLVDPISAPHVVEDLDGVEVKPGGSGEIDKPTAGKKSRLTHISDALGYLVERRFPVDGGDTMTEQSI